MGRRQHRRLPVLQADFSTIPGQRLCASLAAKPFARLDQPWKSGSLTAALVGLGVVVAALLANPVADQVLGAIELLRPCIAGHEARGLPHHVELAVAFDFA